MEFVKWDAKVKEAMDSFVWDRVEKRSVANNTSDSYSGLLYQVPLYIWFWLQLLSAHAS